MRHYGAMVGINADVHGFCVHALRATAATNALAHNADIAKVQEWLGHSNIATYLNKENQASITTSATLYPFSLTDCLLRRTERSRWYLD